MLFPTQSHRVAYETIVQMGRLFFAGENILPRVRLRLFPLLAGPTGVGKSHLVEAAARELEATCFRVTRGDWLVAGCDRGRPTLWQIIDHCVASDRVCLHLDELDKFDRLQESGWSAAIASDVWNLLDGRLQLAEYLRQTAFPEFGKPTPEAIQARLRSTLWIVGSGTWQSTFARAGTSLGFNRTSDNVNLDALTASAQISPELLLRFNDPLILEYPSPEESVQLLHATGVTQLACDLGLALDPSTINWAHGGLRALESFATRLALIHLSRGHPTPERPGNTRILTRPGC